MEEPQPTDAPLVHLISLKHNPAVKDMSLDQLAILVRQIRTAATSAPTMSARLKAESDGIKPRASVTAKRKALLDQI